MGSLNSETPDPRFAEQILGYLNFSSGVPDDQFMKNLNSVFAEQDICPASTNPDASHGSTAIRVVEFLKQAVDLLAESDANFQNATQGSFGNNLPVPQSLS